MRIWQGHARCCLQYRAGCWSVVRGGARRAVRMLPCSVCLPWVIYLAWREPSSGRRGTLWLFADSAPGQQLRLLRVRLALQR